MTASIPFAAIRGPRAREQVGVDDGVRGDQALVAERALVPAGPALADDRVAAGLAARARGRRDGDERARPGPGRGAPARRPRGGRGRSSRCATGRRSPSPHRARCRRPRPHDLHAGAPVRRRPPGPRPPATARRDRDLADELQPGPRKPVEQRRPSSRRRQRPPAGHQQDARVRARRRAPGRAANDPSPNVIRGSRPSANAGIAGRLVTRAASPGTGPRSGRRSAARRTCPPSPRATRRSAACPGARARRPRRAYHS